ncbi:FGFR1 oncogene partner isoform X2 [Trichomycterus rosablanca]|uniref:FGFR1 oncogene partner isoform X2 n=1 Tax=Trichomycterus rosablanca TaxID=2290929 RepID=UPI002F35FF39
MSAAEEDTELRDLLIQNLENSGVLNKIKAELRAAVFLALEEQDKVENKTPLVNENLKNCLNSKDGRLVASLFTDFLQVYNLDFTLAVFQPEINTLNGLDSRESLSKELGLSESEVNKGTPLLLEFIRRGRHKDKSSIFSEGDCAVQIPKELSSHQISEARKKYEGKDKDGSGGISKDEAIGIFSDLLPGFSRSMLERFVTDEIGAKNRNSVDFQVFLEMYKLLFVQCRSVVTSNASDAVHPVSKLTEEKISSSLTSKAEEPKSHNEPLSSQKNRAFGPSEGFLASRNAPADIRTLDLDDDDDDEEGDSFFDDPLPKPQKTYGCSLPSTDKPYSGQRHSEKIFSQKDLSAIGSDTEGDGEGILLDCENNLSGHELRRADSAKTAGRTPSPFSETPLLKSTENSQKEPLSSKNDEDLDYDDDFTSHHSKSEVSIGEEIEEFSTEGPDLSDKLQELTQDISVSQLSQGADYIEDVA